MYYLIFSYLFIRIDNFMFYKNIYKLFFKNSETPWNSTPKSAGTEIFHSTGQTETGSEMVLITMITTHVTSMLLFSLFFFLRTSYFHISIIYYSFLFSLSLSLSLYLLPFFKSQPLIAPSTTTTITNQSTTTNPATSHDQPLQTDPPPQTQVVGSGNKGWK